MKGRRFKNFEMIKGKIQLCEKIVIHNPTDAQYSEVMGMLFYTYQRNAAANYISNWENYKREDPFNASVILDGLSSIANHKLRNAKGNINYFMTDSLGMKEITCEKVEVKIEVATKKIEDFRMAFFFCSKWLELVGTAGNYLILSDDQNEKGELAFANEKKTFIVALSENISIARWQNI